MKYVRLIGGMAALCAVVVAALLFAGVPARSFDLQGTPVTIARPDTDITDTYFFPSPTNASNVVVVMDVHPLIPAGAGTTTFFDQGVLYTMKFDTKYSSEAIGSRPIENVVIQFATGAPTGPAGNQTQQINVYGPATPASAGTTTRLSSGGAASGVGFINRPFSISSGEIQVFAGTRRDPQFFDKTQFFNIFPASSQAGSITSCLSSTCPSGFVVPGTNYFADSNVLSFVVELPKSLLSVANNGTGTLIAYWATTSTTTGH
jgi:hypothetical protein